MSIFIIVECERKGKSLFKFPRNENLLDICVVTSSANCKYNIDSLILYPSTFFQGTPDTSFKHSASSRAWERNNLIVKYGQGHESIHILKGSKVLKLIKLIVTALHRAHSAKTCHCFCYGKRIFQASHTYVFKPNTTLDFYALFKF